MLDCPVLGAGGGSGPPRRPSVVDRSNDAGVERSSSIASAAAAASAARRRRSTETLPPGQHPYLEVVRKKADREALKGVTCAQCEGFYAACEAWGNYLPRPQCCEDAGKASAAGQQQGAAVNTFQARQQRPPPAVDLVQQMSRHRFVFEPNPTPPGFWDMGFGDSLDSRVEKRAEVQRSRANAERRRQLEEDLAAEREQKTSGSGFGGKRAEAAECGGATSGMRQPKI